jgi:hypothetical protein
MTLYVKMERRMSNFVTFLVSVTSATEKVNVKKTDKPFITVGMANLVSVAFLEIHLTFFGE